MTPSGASKEADREDERPHAAGTALAWSETYGFAGFDPASGLGWLARAEVAPNQGFLQVDLSCLLPDGGFIAARHVKSQSANTADLEAEGVRLAMEEPLSRWRITYDGPAHSLASTGDASRRDAWHKSRLERLIVDLVFAAELPPSAAASDLGRATLGEGGFAQPGSVRGEIWVSGDRYDLRAHGSRTKTWGAGPALRAGRCLTIGFDDGTALAIEHLMHEAGAIERGWLWRGGRPVPLGGCAIAAEPDAGSPSALHVSFDDAVAGGRRELSAEMLCGVSLPLERGARRCVLTQSFARVASGGRSGYGLATSLGDAPA